MRIAVIDLGTNSVRFDIHEIVRPGYLHCLFRRKEMVRLGENLFQSRRLQDGAMNRTESVLKDFCKKMESFQVDRVVAGATSATREAKNGKGFVKRIYDNLGIDIRIISGKEEARLILKGIQTFEPLAIGTFAFVDIGGGSTEVGVSHEGKTLYLESFPLGAARLGQQLGSLPADSLRLEEIRKEIRYCLQENCGFKDWPKVEFVLGASGTVKALIRVMKELGEGRKLSRSQLKEMTRRMQVMSIDEIKGIPGMEARRADIIVPGAILLEEVMDFLAAKKISRTKFALREGMLQEELEALGVSHGRTEILFEESY